MPCPHPRACWKEQPWRSSAVPSCGPGCALTELVEVGLGALGPRDGAHQAGLQECAPAVDEAALPSDVVLPGTRSRAQPSLPHHNALLGPHSGTPPALSPLICAGGVVIAPCLLVDPAWDAPWPRRGESPPGGTPSHGMLVFGELTLQTRATLAWMCRLSHCPASMAVSRKKM